MDTIGIYAIFRGLEFKSYAEIVFKRGCFAKVSIDGHYGGIKSRSPGGKKNKLQNLRFPVTFFSHSGLWAKQTARYERSLMYS